MLKVFSVVTVISCVFPLFSFAETSITNKVYENKCNKNVLRNHSAPYERRDLNRVAYICKGSTSSVPGKCYESILLNLKSFSNKQTLDRIASVCTAKNLINRGQLAINRTEKPFKVDAISLN